MLDSLFSNQNIEKILFFLLVNNKCFGAQLRRILELPLTPIQNALLRLEKCGVITSYHEGKTRVYRMNCGYPLYNEIEALVKKAFSLLSTEEKRRYYAQEEDKRLTLREKREVIISAWKQLLTIQQLFIDARSKSVDGWNGRGKGEVIVTKENANTIIFQERGSWHNVIGSEVTFSNCYRWTIDRESCLLSLEHLRHGVENPVFLFHLRPTSVKTLASVDALQCGHDAYFGEAELDDKLLRLHCRVLGPKKNDEIMYYYS